MLNTSMETIETATMSERGQIVIPKDIRDYIGATGNTLFTVATLDEETIVMKKLDTEKLLAQFRSIRKSAQKMNADAIQQEITALRKEKRTLR